MGFLFFIFTVDCNGHYSYLHNIVDAGSCVSPARLKVLDNATTAEIQSSDII
jgi:hypothetical protein